MKRCYYALKSGLFLCIYLLVGLMNPAAAAGVEYAIPMPKVAESLLLDIAAAGDRLVAVGERGHIVYSEDSGDSWVQAQVPTRMMLTRVFFVDENMGWAVGHDGNILLSTDGGVSWTMQRDGLAAQVGVNEERAGRALLKVEQLREQLSLAPDDAREELAAALEDAEWALDNAREKLDEKAYAPPLMDIWFSNEEQGWASGAYGTLLHTHNGGRHWEDWSWKLENPDELHLNGVIGDDSGNVFLASEWGSVFHSENSGETWEMQETGYDGSFFGVLVNTATGTVFAYGLRGTVFLSRNEGLDWQEGDSGVQASLLGSTVSASGSVIFVGQGGMATRSDDDGETFTAMFQPVRKGIHGIAPLDDGRFIGAGEAGSRVLVAPQTQGGQPNE